MDYRSEIINNYSIRMVCELQGVLESFLGHLLAGGVFCLFSGQPLTVLGCTGPVLIFEKILMDFCASYGFYYLTTRLWIGLWSSLFCIIIVAIDGSAIVRYKHFF